MVANTKEGKTLLILGSLSEFVRLTHMAKDRGWRTIVCDGYPDGQAKAFADRSYDIDVRDIPALAAMAKEEKVDAIITSFSDLLFETMVKTAGAAGLPCYMTEEQLPYYRDKNRMKELLLQLGISTPAYAMIQEDFTPDNLKELHFPVVTKPVDMYGSRGLYVLHSAEEVRKYFKEACASSGRKEILVEEYNTGYEFNLMSWVHKGEIHILGIADREKSPTGNHSIPVSTRNIYPSRLIQQVYEPALSILKKYIAATGQKEGALSMQFFWQPGEEVSVCEIAGRFLGYEHELIEYSSGICLEELLLNYAAGDEKAIEAQLNAHSAFSENSSAVVYFQGRPGIIENINAASDVASWPEIAFSQLFCQKGDLIGSQPYVARYYINGKRDWIDQISQKVIDHMTVLDKEGTELLYQNKIPNYPE